MKQELKRLQKDWKLLSTGKFDHTMRHFFGTELCEACFEEPEDSVVDIVETPETGCVFK